MPSTARSGNQDAASLSFGWAARKLNPKKMATKELCVFVSFYVLLHRFVYIIISRIKCQTCKKEARKYFVGNRIVGDGRVVSIFGLQFFYSDWNLYRSDFAIARSQWSDLK